MVENFTSSIKTAGSRTRVNTFLIDTGSVLRTFGTDYAFRSAAWRWADESRQTRTYCLSVNIATLWIGSAWWRLTRILRCCFNSWKCKKNKPKTFELIRYKADLRFKILYLRGGIGLQNLNASPVKPGRHVHVGTWVTTWQSAEGPHVPGQGSSHLFLTQALFEGQSVLITHSGRQPS